MQVARRLFGGGHDDADVVWIDQGLVALHVDEVIGGRGLGDFGDAVSAGEAILGGHQVADADLLAMGGDAVVIGGDKDLVLGDGHDAAAPGALDHRHAEQVDQRFTRQAPGIVARWNDDLDPHRVPRGHDPWGMALGCVRPAMVAGQAGGTGNAPM